MEVSQLLWSVLRLANYWKRTPENNLQLLHILNLTSSHLNYTKEENAKVALNVWSGCRVVKGKHGLKRISEIPFYFWKQSLFSSICAKSIEYNIYIYIYTNVLFYCKDEWMLQVDDDFAANLFKRINNCSKLFGSSKVKFL